MSASPSQPHFADRLIAAVRRTKNPVCLGLDPRLDGLPASLRDPAAGGEPARVADAYRQFCCECVDVVAGRVPVVKPQSAFFEQQGPAGVTALRDVVAHARRAGVLVILDAKRNDIGSTAEAYAAAYLADGDLAADALTVSPYLGADSLEPFIATAGRHGNGLFVLVKTSNPGGRTFQDLDCGGQPLYRHVAAWVEQQAAEARGTGEYGLVGAVVGATYPEQLAELREAMPHTWFLVPGFGAQGGAAGDVAHAFDAAGTGAVINNSRGLLFAHRREPYASRFGESQWQRALEAALDEMIAALAAETPAGRL